MFVVALVIVAGGSFYGGMQYQSGKDVAATATAAASAAGSTRRAFTGTGAGRTAGAGATIGTVLSVDNQGLTIQSRDGSSKVVFITPSTAVQKMVDGSMSDVAAQSNVTIMGATNSDGSITATAIQLRDAGVGFPGAPGSVTSTPAAATSTK